MSSAATFDVAGVERWIRTYARTISANKDMLTELDAAIGDADHGALSLIHI